MAIDWTVDRRGLFAGGLAAIAGAAMLGRNEAVAEPVTPTLFSGARIEGLDSGARFAADGVSAFALPARAHALAKTQAGDVVMVGRRPGEFAAILDAEELVLRAMFVPIAGHRFAGHAALSPDGRTLATTEIAVETSAGRLVLRDPLTGAVRETIAVGIEPHDVLYAKDGAHILVAEGGIAYDLAVKGPAVNAGRIESAVVELDAASGRVLKRHRLSGGLRSLSIRHMAFAPDGETVAFGMQDQDKGHLRPLTGILRVGHSVELLPLPPNDEGALRWYVGSMAVDASGAFVAATSPKGGIAAVWRLSDGAYAGAVRLTDVCGLAADSEAGTFWITSGMGDVMQVAVGADGVEARAHWQANAAFDNHLLRI